MLTPKVNTGASPWVSWSTSQRWNVEYAVVVHRDLMALLGEIPIRGIGSLPKGRES